jgi:energy-coupling factor transporter ATP-binding protein EcfA2
MKSPNATDSPRQTLASGDGPDVDIKNVSYRYPGSKGQALRGVTLQVNRGELVLITGASGSGKTTLLCMLNGMVPQSYGGDFSGAFL